VLKLAPAPPHNTPHATRRRVCRPP
jgi:hypothetical protein